MGLETVRTGISCDKGAFFPDVLTTTGRKSVFLGERAGETKVTAWREFKSSKLSLFSAQASTQPWKTYNLINLFIVCTNSFISAWWSCFMKIFFTDLGDFVYFIWNLSYRLLPRVRSPSWQLRYVQYLMCSVRQRQYTEYIILTFWIQN